MTGSLQRIDGGSAQSVPEQKLRTAACEFEAMLLADLLKMADQENESHDGAMQGYNDMRIQSVAKALASNGGVGIADLIIRQLGPRNQSDIKDLSDSADT